MTQEEFNRRYSFSAQDIISNCGRIGSIYRAYDNVLHREVTIKMARTGCKAFNEKRFFLKDEFEVLKRIPKHQNIVFYDEYYCFEGSVMSYDSDYVVMPYRFESNLSDLIQRGLTREQKESIAIQLLDGLDFLHKNNVIHGNFDPWSILVIRTRDGFAPLLTNFGLNKPLPYDFPETPSDPSFYNRAPWGGYDEKNGKNGDLMMFGIVLYELFTGQPLYKDFEAINRPKDYEDFWPGAAAKCFWDNVRVLLGKMPSLWSKMTERCIIPNNIYDFDMPDNVTTKVLYDIIIDYNAPELVLVDDDQLSNMQSTVVNGYTLRHQLGVGGMAEVWYAENRIGKKAAVKMLLTKFCDDEEIVARFENEAKVMVKLEHPNIRQVYDYTTVDGRPCIIMEYLEGDDLKSMMKQGRQFTHEELVKWWNQMVAALNYTHQLGVVHRDIKPSNIFIDKYGNVRLLDFGIAKYYDNAARTLTGSTMGTLLYMSPEQVKDPKRVGYKSDIYSLAVTFVHLITNKAPYDSTSSSNFEIQMNIVQKPLELSGLLPVWQNILEPYLAKNPQDRPTLKEINIEDFDKVEEAHTIYDYSKTADLFLSTRVNDFMSFSEAFETARQEFGVNGVFEWHGHIYGTKTAEEWNALSSEEKEHYWGEVLRITTDREEPNLVAPSADLVVTVNGVSFVMKYVEGGTFQMGATLEQGDDACEDEKPVHGVRLSSFFIGETPVTQALWKAVMDDNPSEFKGDDLPVDSIWRNNGLYEFVMKLNRLTGKKFRLPTEAEWEFAARGGNNSKGYKYAGSDDLNRVGWFRENSGLNEWNCKTHPVKQKEHNELGLYDMCGNVLEWCSDEFQHYDGGFQTNPCYFFNDTGLHSQVARGGCFQFVEKACRVSSRFNTNQTVRPCWFGLRLALSTE